MTTENPYSGNPRSVGQHRANAERRRQCDEMCGTGTSFGGHSMFCPYADWVEAHGGRVTRCDNATNRTEGGSK